MGSRPPASKEKPPGTETETFQMVYRFDAIRAFGYLSRLKVAQTALTVVALPPGLYWYSQGLMTFNSLCLAGGIAGFALAMLCWMSHFFRRLVGILYVNESGTMLRVAHLTFWGRRQETYCPVADVIPMKSPGSFSPWKARIGLRSCLCGSSSTMGNRPSTSPCATDASWTESVSHRCLGCWTSSSERAGARPPAGSLRVWAGLKEGVGQLETLLGPLGTCLLG